MPKFGQQAVCRLAVPSLRMSETNRAPMSAAFLEGEQGRMRRTSRLFLIS